MTKRRPKVKTTTTVNANAISRNRLLYCVSDLKRVKGKATGSDLKFVKGKATGSGVKGKATGSSVKGTPVAM